MSSHNPFRTPAASPNATGSSYAPPPDPPPQRHAPPSTPRPPTPDDPSVEAPPPYTTRPAVYEGESTLEYGPARPFQTAPPPLPPPMLHPPGGSGFLPPPMHPQHSGFAPPQHQQQPSLWQQLTGAPSSSGSGSGWAAYPGRPPQQYQPPPQQYAPPHQQYAPPPPQQPPPHTHVSEFARDFYATTAVPPGAFSDVSGARAGGAGPAGYPPPPVPPPLSQTYQPPPGAPPPRGAEGDGAGAAVPDDGRPTSTPIPGHPLLRGGKMLVYPPHYTCAKCNNTGYKHADPTHPCSKCWEKHARPYAGALLHAPSASSAAPASPSSTFQRPLPHPSPAPPPPSQGYAPPPSQFAPPIVYSAPPPPGAYPPPAQVYPPGDARLGGAPCWRCGGRGSVSFLVFETVMCTVCGGVGRVYG
ncbi:hypothetical protein B0H15DRAFT_797789 [Mycena belliarum]|uniref:Uncharacterized protein n=1 Tax=Mycena belliarum TaxID=1033014 RepID=A0AAD6UC94_9AGAR|nr:hypothetical protein B0H15DRAFT_797789 [Mycena belliae]